jgi:hypothetical protein
MTLLSSSLSPKCSASIPKEKELDFYLYACMSLLFYQFPRQLNVYLAHLSYPNAIAFTE